MKKSFFITSLLLIISTAVFILGSVLFIGKTFDLLIPGVIMCSIAAIAIFVLLLLEYKKTVQSKVKLVFNLIFMALGILSILAGVILLHFRIPYGVIAIAAGIYIMLLSILILKKISGNELVLTVKDFKYIIAEFLVTAPITVGGFLISKGLFETSLSLFVAGWIVTVISGALFSIVPLIRHYRLNNKINR